MPFNPSAPSAKALAPKKAATAPGGMSPAGWQQFSMILSLFFFFLVDKPSKMGTSNLKGTQSAASFVEKGKKKNSTV